MALLAAHELRNELQVSTGHLSQIEADDEHVDAVERSIDQLSGIVDKVVSLASSDSPTFEPEQQWLSTVVWDVWSSLSLEAASLEVTSDRRLLADAESMRLFVEILLSNAVEHGGPDVAIRVGATSSGFSSRTMGPVLMSRHRSGCSRRGTHRRNKTAGSDSTSPTGSQKHSVVAVGR